MNRRERRLPQLFGPLPGSRSARRLVALLALTCSLMQGCTRAPEPGTNGDFAVLARAESGYREARPGRELRFPVDHGTHPDYRIEWWYLTANLEDSTGRPYGLQWTLFRTATAPPGEPRSGSSPPANPWRDPQIYMAHFAITTPVDHVAFQRYARGGEFGDEFGDGAAGLARAGATAEPFAAWLDDWSLASVDRVSGDLLGADVVDADVVNADADNADMVSANMGWRGSWLPLELRASQYPYAARLRLDSERPLVLQGDAGYMPKHPAGGGSHYYSQPFLQAAGELVVDGVVVPVTGQAWLDREWSSQFLQPDQQGWDWFALHLESGEKLMIYRLRSRAGPDADYRHGVLIAPDGGKTPLEPGSIALDVLATTPVAGRDLPLHWRIRLPTIDRELEVEALHPRQWMAVDFAYWEGVVQVRGDDPGTRGRGYLELTGYPAQ